jgi:predicted deacylase
MALDSYPIQLGTPDIESYRAGNTGVEYVTTFDSGRPGPNVMINAVTHGNELCGAIAVDFLFRHEVRPTRGKLTLGFANVAAYLSFDPKRPTESRFVDEDFNRVWDDSTLEGRRDSVELRRARAMRPVIDKVDFLLDIHSMQHPTPPLMLCGPLPKGRQFARALGFPLHIVADKGHAAGRRLRDYSFFGEPDDPRNALLIECGQHWEKSSETVALDTTLRFLMHLDVIDRAFAREHIRLPDAPVQKVVSVVEAVTVSRGDFRFAADYRGMEVLPEKGTLIGYDGDRPVVTPHDDCVLIMPSRRLSPGQTAVRLGRFVD